MIQPSPIQNSAKKTQNLVLGIDAGNTKTIALIAHSSGQILGWGRGGQANIYVSKAAALAAIDKAVLEAISMAGVSADLLCSSVLSATGADWPEDFVLLKAELEKHAWGERVQVVNDAVGALRAGSSDGNGVMVVCGTSAGIAARNLSGTLWHSSYWQEPEGAEQLGQKTLRAVYRAELGIDPPTTLTRRVLKHFAAPHVEAVLHAQTRRNAGPNIGLQTGRLARALLDEAALGDPTALKIVQEHASSLGDYALAAARQVGLEHAFPLVTAGGVMRHHSKLLQHHMLERVRQDFPDVHWVESRLEPVVGAVLLALDELGPVTNEVYSVLESSLPPAALIET